MTHAWNLSLKLRLDVSPKDLMKRGFRESEPGEYSGNIGYDHVRIDIASRDIKFSEIETLGYLIDRNIARIEFLERELK